MVSRYSQNCISYVMSLLDYIDKRTANVIGIYGHLGGGKTLTAVDLSLGFLKLGWSVTTNINIFIDKAHQCQYSYIEDIFDVDPWTFPVGAPRGSNDPFRSVIVIDEVAEFFDQYSYSSPLAKRFLSWLRHSSKRGQFVFLIVQHPDFLNGNLRKLVHKWIICDDMEQFRLPVLKIKIPFWRDYVARRLFDKLGNLLSRGLNFVRKSDIGRYYDTAQSIAVEGRNTTYTSYVVPTVYDYTVVIYVVLVLINIILLFVV